MIFKNSIGGFLLEGLFYERTLADKSNVTYTLKDQDHAGFPSLYRLYMETNDPTEYTFAIQHLDGWAHWERLCECTWFKPFVARWRREIDLRYRAGALKNIYDIAQSEGKDRLAANKIIVSGGWQPTEAVRRGRPTKADVKQEAHRLAQETHSLNEDFQRITERVN